MRTLPRDQQLFDTCVRRGVIFGMHTLDRLAAIAIVLQFIVVCVLGWFLYANQVRLVTLDEAILVDRTATATPTPTTVSESPTPSVTLHSGFLKGASSAATLPVKPLK